MTDGVKSPFEQSITEWEGQAKKFFDALQANQNRMVELSKTLEKPAELVSGGWSPGELEKYKKSTILQRVFGLQPPQFITGIKAQAEKRQAKAEILTTTNEIERNDFYYRMYNEVPYAISKGQVKSVDDILTNLVAPGTLTPTEMAEVRNTISGMFNTIKGTKTMPEMAEEFGVPNLPTLVAPSPAVTLPGIHRITIDSIKKILMAPKAPPQVMTDEEWNQFLKDSGQVDANGEPDPKAIDLVAEWQERNNKLTAFKTGIAEMPDYKLVDLLKEMVVQPGLGLMEIYNIYYEHTVAPLSGFVYKPYFPDIEVAYQKYKKDNTEWKALQLAWKEWDAPGPVVLNWILKYIIMEGPYDPLNYIGWGVFTKITKPIPYVGRLVGALESGYSELMELPFDGIKSLAGKLPKTITQRALIVQNIAGQTVQQFMEDYTGKFFNQMVGTDWDDAAEVAVKAFFENPDSVEKAVVAGRQFLAHTPITEDIVANWAEELGTTLARNEITKETVESVNNVFEDFFTRFGAIADKEITTSEAASRLLGILASESTDEDVLVKAITLLQNRGDKIVAGALSFGQLGSPYKAIQALMKRNFRIEIVTEESAAALARKQAGAFATLIANVEPRVLAIWRNGINKWVVRPFAEAYLAYGLYGPMNVAEDYVRSALGGVRPGRMNNRRFEILANGLAVDPNLRAKGLSEMIGPTRRLGEESTWSNWILQIGGLAKDWGSKVYEALVELPGAYGMEVRRNFVAGRYLQILKETGGDQYSALTKLATKFTESASKQINEDVSQFVIDTIVQGNPDLIREGVDMFTKKTIYRQEVRNILSEHPDLPNTVRDFILKQFDDDILFKEIPIPGVTARDAMGRFTKAADTINDVIKQADTITMDEFLRGGEYATKQYEALAKVLTEFDVANPEDMAQLILSLNKMSDLYGATPNQILAQATIHSRGLPFEERNPIINKALDDITDFVDKSGISMDNVVEKIRGAMIEAGVAPDYITEANRLLDLQTTKRVRATELGEEINTWRHDYFADATKTDLKNPTFWDDFYRESEAKWHTFNIEMTEFDGRIAGAIEDVNLASGIKVTPRPPIRVVGRPLAPNDVATLIGCRGDDISKALLDVMTTQNDRDMFIAFVMGKVKAGDVGFTKEAIGQVYDQICYSLKVSPESMSWITGKRMELEALRQDLHYLHGSKLLPDEEVVAIGKYLGDTADKVRDTIYEKGAIKSQFATYNDLRQSAMDEAQKWYYKEFTDYTHANAFDAMMKNIYPYWTYESQRWFWLPRAMLKHPAVFSQWGKWMNNSDGGYVHIPGTSIDINPFRGTVFGTLTTRLTRRDYPEYYDSLGAVGNLVEFNDFLSRYGFYPGAHISLIQSTLLSKTPQLGEALPAMYKTTLDALVGMFPDNEVVNWISNHVFADRFRDYLTIKEVDKHGGNGTLISAKKNEGEELTPDEQAMWNSARRESSLYSAGFEQFSMFRMRSDEQYKMFEETGKAIEQMTGYTPEQQDWLRAHGYRLWDMVGGLSPTEQSVLQELGYYNYIGATRPLLPGKQQDILDKIELGWEDVRRYTESRLMDKIQLQRDFLSGVMGPDDYNTKLSDLYKAQRAYIDNKIADYPLMDLDNRKDYYKKYNTPLPVLHPMKELLNLYFEIELKEITDPETGEKVMDWDTFWKQREAIESAIPDDLKQEWQDYLSKNSTALEELRREVYSTYLKPYNELYDVILKTYGEDEQKLIKEYLSLERRGIELDRQAEIQNMMRSNGKLLISNYRTDVSNARLALRFANPTLDAWLNYWGQVSSFRTKEAEEAYQQICADTGRSV